MANRKALLIGVEEYGEGFSPLPAVREDTKNIRGALEAAGYEIALCLGEDLRNASKLDATMREFCKGGGPEDIRVIYFTGHGILADNVDWVIPAGVRREDAAASPNQRVSTDLSRTVTNSKTGLVLFIIDACRDPADVPATKGGVAWGDPERLSRPGEHRFIRFFGCAANQVCQVIPSEGGELKCSLFTLALTECISQGNAVSLEELLSKVALRCTDLLAKNLTLQAQSPRLSYGEHSDEVRNILTLEIFNQIRTPTLMPVWQEFDPNKLHCLVVLSEYEAKKSPEWSLADLVRDAIAGKTGGRIWNAFLAASNNLRLISGKHRSPPAIFEPSAIHISIVSVLDVFASNDTLDTVVRAIAEADLVVFDVTGFEPGIMLLVGIRSACRRWLTVCSHGANWKEGMPLEDMPFNLQDINISSHTQRDSLTGADPVVERFVSRVETGFAQAARQPYYLDLPAYDALRQLGSDYSASSTINPSERILVLCAYKDFFKNWQFISSQLKQVLSNKKNYQPEIQRIIDYGTTQLIRQSIYELIRRTAVCVVDWSEFSASVFLELGVRLAISEWGAIQIIDNRNLAGGEGTSKRAKLEQVEQMRRLLTPIPYKYGAKSSDAFNQVVDLLDQRNPSRDGSEADYNHIYRSVVAAIGTIQEAKLPVVDELKHLANSLHHPEQGRASAPQILFYGSKLAKSDSELAALERRIAAWLYLEHRVQRANLMKNEELLKTYHKLAQQTLGALYDLGDDESLDFATYIENRLKQRN